MKRIFALLLCAVVFVLLPANAFAQDDAQDDTYHSVWEGLDYEEKSLDTLREGFLEGLRLEKLTEPPDSRYYRLIHSYDVSEDGKIAIAFENEYRYRYSPEHIIAVYDEDFTFEYAVSFRTDLAHGVLWYGDNIALMLARGDCGIIINENAEAVNLCDISPEGNNWIETVYSRTRTWGGYTYLCYDRTESERLIKYSSTGNNHVLQRTDAEGNVEVLYETEQRALHETLPILLSLIVFIVCCYIVIRIVKAREKADLQKDCK